MQHRIFLVPPRSGLSWEQAHRHWRERHAGVFAATPHLAGYVQNRPVPDAWPTQAASVCSELWFADRAAERAAFASAHYRGAVTEDEQRFLDRERAWLARVVREERVRGGRPAAYRVLAFGSAHVPAAGDGAASILHLDRPAPGGDDPAVASVWAASRPAADRLAAGMAGLAFVTEPAAVVAPPVWPWAGG